MFCALSRSGLDEAKDAIYRRRMEGVQKLVSSLAAFQRSAKVTIMQLEAKNADLAAKNKEQVRACVFVRANRAILRFLALHRAAL